MNQHNIILVDNVIPESLHIMTIHCCRECKASESDAQKFLGYITDSHEYERW